MEAILALQAKHKKGTQLQLAIMTSLDTHERTKVFLQSNKYFGAKPSQIHLIMQEKVKSLDCIPGSTSTIVLLTQTIIDELQNSEIFLPKYIACATSGILFVNLVCVQHLTITRVSISYALYVLPW